MNFFLFRSGNQTGPYPMASLPAMHQAGQVLPTDYIWVEGTPSWVPISNYLSSNPARPAAAAPPPLPAAPAVLAPASPVGPPPLSAAQPTLDGPTNNLIQEVEAGGRFVIFTYCVSVLIMTFKRSSNVVFLRKHEDGAGDAIRYSLISGVAGWWGIPWGPIWTIAALISNARGGRDVTREVLTQQLGPQAAASILARRQKPAPAGMLMKLFRAGLIGIPVLLVALISGLAAIPSGTGSRSSNTPGKAAFTEANRLITRNEGSIAFGNTPEGIAIASDFSRSMKSLQALGFKGGRENGYSASKHEFLTYCDLRPTQCIILVHVPELRRYTAEAKDTLCNLCWMRVQAALRNQKAGTNGMKVVIGVRGIAIYDRVMTGTYVAEATEGNDGLASSARYSEELLYSYFDDAQKGAAAPSQPAQ